MGEAKNSFICLIKVCDINFPVLFPFAYDAISSPAIMPTIVTEIVQSMFRNPKSKRDFANALKEIPIASESDASDAESLDSEASSARSGASAMTDVVVGPREEYKRRSVELSRARDQAILKLEDDAENHLLMLKQACLGADAVAGERNVIELHTNDFSDKEQRHPICSLTLGKNEFVNLDLCLGWSKNKDVKLKLVMGSGPVSVSGMRFVEYLDEAAGVDDQLNDPDYVTEEETENETEVSGFEDPEEVDPEEVKALEADLLEGEDEAAKRKREKSPAAATKKSKTAGADA